MARFIGAPTRYAPWVLWIWFKDGGNYETACRFDRQEDAENYARNRLADSEEVEKFALSADKKEGPSENDHPAAPCLIEATTADRLQDPHPVKH